jgi:hypothetical protein
VIIAMIAARPTGESVGQAATARRGTTPRGKLAGRARSLAMFKLTIRDLLWLTLLAAILAAWWVDRSKLINQYEAKPPRVVIRYPDTLWQLKKEPVKATNKTDGDFLD